MALIHLNNNLEAAAGHRLNPTYSIGVPFMQDTDTRVYSSNITVFDESFVVPNRWKDADYFFQCRGTSTASYNCFGIQFRTYINDVQQNYWAISSFPTSYWWRSNSGTRTFSNTYTLKANDVLRWTLQGTWRTTGPTPSSTIDYLLQRSS